MTRVVEVDDELESLEPLEGAEPAGPLTRLHGVLFVVLGAFGLFAAFTLSVDKYKLLADPSYVPGCNLNPIISCGSVMKTDQAEVFGFPNSLIGMAAFTVVVVLGVLIAARTPLPRWVLGGLAAGTVLGAVFVHWLAFQSIYRIGALCPWCMVVWTVTIALALWTVLLAARTVPALRRPAELVWSVRYLVLLLWYLAFVIAALIQFWDYWRTLL